MMKHDSSWKQGVKSGRPVLSATATAVAAGALIVAGLIGPRIEQGDVAPHAQSQRTAVTEAELLERRLLAEARALGTTRAASPVSLTEAELLERRLLAEARALGTTRAASPVPLTEAELLERRLLAEARALGE